MTICVAYSSSAEGAAALDLAVREARLREMRLMVLSVVRQDRFDQTGHDPAQHDALRQEVTAHLGDLAASAALTWEMTVVEDGGNAGEALIDLAVQAEAQLLVIGARRRSPVGKFLMGSTAQRVLLDAPMPVLVAHVG